MAHMKAAKKAIRKSAKNHQRNVGAKKSLKKSIRKVTDNISTEDKAKLEKMAKSAISKIDKTKTRGIIHKKTAARKKSRLMKKVNQSLKKISA